MIIAITGGIASGKSYASLILQKLGYETLDVDSLYHDLIEPQKPLYNALVEQWGSGIVAPDGTIERKKLAAVVFSDSRELEILNEITHPAIIHELERIVSATEGTLFIEMPAIDGMRSFSKMDQLWFITAPYELRLSRLMQRNNLTHEQAQLRITSQPAEEKFIKLADRILISDEKLEENLKKAIEEAKHEYRVE